MKLYMEPKKIVIPGDKVTQEDVENAIVAEYATKIGNKIVIVHLTLRDGFEVIGKAGVVDAKLFDMAIGTKYARIKAMDRAWEHLGSVLQDRKAK